jgi:phage terminase Nu1 subunit (DNA packaging protein)
MAAAIDIFGVEPNTIKAWVGRGCPVVVRGSRGTEWAFNTKDVFNWKTEEAVKHAIGRTEGSTQDELKCRKLAAETTLVELSAAKERGEVVYIDEVVRTTTDDYIGVKVRLRNIPQRVSAMLLGELDERRIKDVIMEEIDEALNSCANRFIEVEAESDSETKRGETAGMVATA